MQEVSSHTYIVSNVFNLTYPVLIILSPEKYLLASHHYCEFFLLLFAGLMEGLKEELRYGNRYPNIKLTVVHPFVVDTGLAKKPKARWGPQYRKQGEVNSAIGTKGHGLFTSNIGWNVWSETGTTCSYYFRVVHRCRLAVNLLLHNITLEQWFLNVYFNTFTLTLYFFVPNVAQNHTWYMELY